jgi:hypothetical protein
MVKHPSSARAGQDDHICHFAVVILNMRHVWFNMTGCLMLWGVISEGVTTHQRVEIGATHLYMYVNQVVQLHSAAGCSRLPVFASEPTRDCNTPDTATAALPVV